MVLPINRRVRRSLAVTAEALALVFALQTQTWSQPASSLQERMLLAEDARAQSEPELAPLREGLSSRDPKIRRQAVRGIGRLERPELIASLTRALADDNADVRMEAANAVGQLARGPKGVDDAATRLHARARVEGDPRVWAVVAATLGRLPYTSPEDVDRAETALARVLPTANATAIQIDAVLGAAQGLEALVRQGGKLSRLKPATLQGLRAASALEGRPQDADKLARIRRLATLALTAAGGATRPDLEKGIADPDEEVRRLTMVAARGVIEGRESVIAKGLGDGNSRVRYEALQTWGRQFQKTSCDPIVKAVHDPDKHVSLLAIDLLGNGCPGGEGTLGTLQPLAEALATRPGEWHAPAHAIVALAKTAPAEARKLLPRYVTHGIWQVRMYAAHAAGALAALDELDALGRDAHDNVREAALGELIVLKRPEAIPLAVDALRRPDYQLVITASRALAAASRFAEVKADKKEQAIPALFEALARITKEQRETSRDPRLAMLDRLKDLGFPDGSALGDRVEGLRVYLMDYDPAVAMRTAEILASWQKMPAAAAARPLPRMAVSQSAVDALRDVHLRFVMAGRGAFDLRLLTDEAPVSALRVATRAREGYYNGLTFHRVAANFVIQGGSPGANEYSGDRLYMRDEVGLPSHRRSTVGISTRGRDTGDAQIFINLIDSPRLDHIYTVFAEVVSGMDVVDAILEGDVIERVEIVQASSR